MCIAGNFEEAKFLMIGGFNLVNLWPCTVEHEHNGLKWWVLF